MGAGWQLPGYELEELVGFGATGEVWRARELSSGHVVALKRMRSGDPLARERLRREAALLSSVAGDHVVRLRDVLVTETDAVLVMDYAAGGNLASVLAVRGRLAAPEVVTLVGPLALALADAHGRGIVHGDVTPANIVFTADGRPLLTDFGVARIVGETVAATEATPAYAAPEVLSGQPPLAASDVYSLCKVADAALDRAAAPPALAAAIDAGLDVQPGERPSATELADSVLASCAAAPVRLVRGAAPVPPAVTVTIAPRGVEPEELPAPPRVRVAVRVPRRLVITVASAVMLVAAVAGGVVWGHRTQSAAAVLPPPSPPALEATATTTPAPALPVWRDVVRRLDLLRAQALTTGDEQLLRAVYVAGSRAFAVDAATLRALAARGWHVRGFAITTRSVNPDVVTPDAATLTVTDVMSSYSVVDGSGRVVAVARARPARTFALQLERVGTSWRIGDISR